MRRADRLIELARHLRQDKLVTADELAGLLEVAVRTVYRDIVALQVQGFPIEGQAGLGYILRGPIDLPAMTFDHDHWRLWRSGSRMSSKSATPRWRLQRTPLGPRLMRPGLVLH